MTRTIDLTGTQDEWHYEATIEAIVAARNDAAGCVEPGGLAERIRLVVGELAANAVLHAGSPFTVVVQVGREWIRVEVHDRSVAVPVMRRPDPLALDGRGLHLVHGLSVGWGSFPTAAGKVVWAQLANAPVHAEQGAALSAAARRRSLHQLVPRLGQPSSRAGTERGPRI